MSRALALAAGLMLSAVAMAPGSGTAQQSDHLRYEAHLSGANVAPEPVDTDAAGRATALLDGNTLTVIGSFADLSSPLRDIEEEPDDPGIHIHPGDEDQTSDYIYGLRAETGPEGTSGIFYGTVTLSDEQRQMLLDEWLYLDIHTEEHADGELRAQLRPARIEIIPQQQAEAE